VSENDVRARPRPTDTVRNKPLGRFPVHLVQDRQTIAWVDMLSRIGQRNSQLFDYIARQPLARTSAERNQDVQARGRARDVLKELERERSRIARDLHAGAGQPLAGIKLNLELLVNCANGLPQTGREALVRLQNLADQALDQVRAVSHTLHPPDWQALTTVEAVRRLVGASGLADRVTVRLQLQEFPKEPVHAVKVAVYRCAQECISNVARHSGATELRISLSADERVVTLLIEDNGSGFKETTGSSSGIGLLAIREHADALDGFCDISSGADGVTVLVRLPLDPDLEGCEEDRDRIDAKE